MNIGIYVYKEVEVLDFCGPFEVFSTANRFLGPDKSNVFLIAQTKEPVCARGGLKVNPDFDIDSHPVIDVLIVPGGIHHNQLELHPVMSWVSQVSDKAQIVASVCTGVFLLAHAGVLSHQKVTTHWQDLQQLKMDFPELSVLQNRRWVQDGKYITSAGISAGIDMSLYLISEIHNLSLAEKTARQMEYNWHR